MATAVDICNVALTRLGDRLITSLSGPSLSEQERKCASVYNLCRDIEMAAMDYPFARKTVELAATTTTPDMDWDYQYALPGDYNPGAFIKTENFTDFELSGNCVLSNESSLTVTYGSKITDTTKFPMEFVNLLIARIALELSYAVSDNASLTATMQGVYDDARKAAKRICATNSGRSNTNQRNQTGNWLDA